jgi:hypothetical protein
MSSQDILLLTPGRPALYTTTRALFPALLPTSPTVGDVWKEFKKSGQFVDDLQICCHFTTHNSATALKTIDETITFLVCLFVLSEQLVHSLSCIGFSKLNIVLA